MKRLALALVAASLVCGPALAQNAVTQNGSIVTQALPIWQRDRTVGSIGGLTGATSGPLVGLGAKPFGVTDSLGIGLQFNTATTTGSYHWLGIGHNAAGAPIFNVDGTDYPFLGLGNGNVVGPGSSALNEVASFNTITGTLLRQGAAAVTDNRTTALVADGAALSLFSESGSPTAHHIWTCTIGTCDTPLSLGNYDAVRGITVSTGAQTVDIASAVSGYLINSVARTPPYPSFPVSAVINGTGICNADGCGTWGINTIVTDNAGHTISAHGARFIVGGEFDTQVTSPSTRVAGVYIGGSSLVQPAAADGYGCLYLDGAASAGTVAKWTDCISSQDGAAVAFAIIGAKEATGTNINSQEVDYRFLDGAGVQQTLSMAATPGGFLISTTGVATSGSIAIPAGAVYNAGTGGGYQLNSKTFATNIGTLVTIASDTTWATVNVGNPTSALALFGGSVVTKSGDSKVLLTDGAGTDFGRLQFGGTTNAFPALKRSGTGLQVRDAADTVDTGLKALSITTSDSAFLHITTAALADGAALAAGTLLNAPAAGDPTKWIPINDNGTTRYIPAW